MAEADMLHAGMTTLLAQRQSSGSMQQGPGVWSGSLSEAFWPPAHGIRRCAAGTREYLRCAKHHLYTFFQPLPMPRTQHFYLHAGLNVVAGYFVVVPIWGCWPPVHLSKYRVASHHSHIAPLTQMGQRAFAASHADAFCVKLGIAKQKPNAHLPLWSSAEGNPSLGA